MTTGEQVTEQATTGSPAAKALVWLGLVLSLVVFAFVLRGFDWRRFLDIIAQSNLAYAAMVPVAIAAEQAFRAVKWRELLRPLGAASVTRLFNGIMAGYFTNYFSPVKISFLVRAWIAARATGAPMPSVLGTVALGRAIDALVFAPIIVLAASTVSLAGDDGAVTKRLLWSALASFAILIALGAMLFHWAHKARRGQGLPAGLVSLLPARWHARIESLSAAFAGGLRLPRRFGPLALIFGSAVLMKIAAASHIGFAGLALGVDVQPLQYLFIMVCLGFMVVIASYLKVVGGFLAGAIFLLQQFGVDLETATAIAVMVSLSSRITVTVTGALGLWLERIDVTDLRRLAATARSRDGATG